MRQLPFSRLTRDDIKGLAKLHDHGARTQPWDELAHGEISATEQHFIDYVTAAFQRVPPSLVNEATVWGRAIYPLLWLAETDDFVAQADVALTARFGEVELSGSADGAFGTSRAGELLAPFLIVLEAKRGVEGGNPVAQLHGEILAAAWLNARETGVHTQRMYGAYTVGDDWTFVRADVEELDTDRPSLTVVSSREINEKMEVKRIVKILKSIVAGHTRDGELANRQ